MPNEQPRTARRKLPPSAISSNNSNKRSTTKPVTGEGREATVIAISGDLVFLDLGMKEEGALPAASLSRCGGRTDSESRATRCRSRSPGTIRRATTFFL